MPHRTAEEVLEDIESLENSEKIKLLEALYQKHFDTGVPSKEALRAWLEDQDDE